MPQWTDLSLEVKSVIVQKTVEAIANDCRSHLHTWMIHENTPACQFSHYRSLLLVSREFHDILSHQLKIDNRPVAKHFQHQQHQLVFTIAMFGSMKGDRNPPPFSIVSAVIGPFWRNPLVLRDVGLIQKVFNTYWQTVTRVWLLTQMEEFFSLHARDGCKRYALAEEIWLRSPSDEGITFPHRLHITKAAKQLVLPSGLDEFSAFMISDLQVELRPCEFPDIPTEYPHDADILAIAEDHMTNWWMVVFKRDGPSTWYLVNYVDRVLYYGGEDEQYAEVFEVIEESFPARLFAEEYPRSRGASVYSDDSGYN